MQRTTQQNRAMHKYFELVAMEANRSGITYSEFIRRRPRLEMFWTPERVKEIWRTAQEFMFGTKSTADMQKNELDRIYDVVNKVLGEEMGFSVPFPSYDEITEAQS